MKLMQKIMLRLFGRKPANKGPKAPIKFITTVPNEKPSEEEWMNEFRVGMLWDRKIVKID